MDRAGYEALQKGRIKWDNLINVNTKIKNWIWGMKRSEIWEFVEKWNQAKSRRMIEETLENELVKPLYICFESYPAPSDRSQFRRPNPFRKIS